MHVGSWDGAYRGLLPDEYLDAMDVARWTAGWTRLLGSADPRSVTLVCGSPEGTVIGFAGAGPTRDDDGDPLTTPELMTIYALPGSWGAGGAAS